MTKRKKVSSSAKQIGIEFTDSSLDISREISNAISSSLKKAPISRYHVAARISELVGREITKTMLDNWSGESHERHRMPSDIVPAFCIATGSNELIEVLAEFTNGIFANGKDAKYLELAKVEARRDRLNKQIEELKKEII